MYAIVLAVITVQTICAALKYDEVYYNVGDQVILTCPQDPQHDEAQLQRFTWYRTYDGFRSPNSLMILQWDSLSGQIVNDKISDRADSVGFATLRFNNTQPEDSGEYKCLVVYKKFTHNCYFVLHLNADVMHMKETSVNPATETLNETSGGEITTEPTEPTGTVATGAILGIVISVAILCLLIAILIYCRKIKRSGDPVYTYADQDGEANNPLRQANINGPDIIMNVVSDDYDGSKSNQVDRLESIPCYDIERHDAEDLLLVCNADVGTFIIRDGEELVLSYIDSNGRIQHNIIKITSDRYGFENADKFPSIEDFVHYYRTTGLIKEPAPTWRVTKDYSAQAEDELSLRVDDEVLVISKTDKPGKDEDALWWRGMVNGKIGYIHNDYLTR